MANKTEANLPALSTPPENKDIYKIKQNWSYILFKRIF